MKRSLPLALGAVVLAGWAVARARHLRFTFDQKVCLITGGSRGLGLVLARQICNAGGRVAILARDQEELARAREDLAARGGNVLPVTCDVTERVQIEAAVRQVADQFGGIDVVINNAGIIEVGPLEHMAREDYERAMNIHFWAPFHVIMAALPHLRQRAESRIVNIASIGGRLAVPHLAAYSASKFALVGLSDAFRAELARDNIQVTTVTPGMMRTGSHIQAKFKGRHAAEYSWFAVSASLPLISMSAERAATKILNACRAGVPTLALPISTRAAIIADAVFPNTTARLMKLANRMLPGATGSEGDALRAGAEVRPMAAIPSWLTRNVDRATARNNEQY